MACRGLAIHLENVAGELLYPLQTSFCIYARAPSPTTALLFDRLLAGVPLCYAIGVKTHRPSGATSLPENVSDRPRRMSECPDGRRAQHLARAFGLGPITRYRDALIYMHHILTTDHGFFAVAAAHDHLPLNSESSKPPCCLAPAVRGPKYVAKKGKTPVLTDEARTLLDSSLIL
jgi:hypothetical protein